MIVQQCGRKSGFSLIEMVIVVVIMGVIAAIAVPRFQDGARKAGVANLIANVRELNETVEFQYQINQMDNYPATIDPAWFVGDKIPKHPWNTMGVPNVQVLSAAGVMHPTNKVLKAGIGGAYWEPLKNP